MATPPAPPAEAEDAGDQAKASSSSPSSSSSSTGRLNYSGCMILAPMVKIGTLPTRLLALEYGADLVYTEEIIDFRLLRCRRIENRIFDTVDYVDCTDETLVLRISPRERGRLVLQLGTGDPDRAAEVARRLHKDVDGIDLNCGCPKSFSLKGGMGAALLAQPDKIVAILSAMIQAVDIPVTCKIRILPKLEDTLALVEKITSTGIAALAVHGRTKEERPNHSNNVDFIKEVVKHCRIPVIANGGSSNNRNSADNTYEGIKKFWSDSGAASVMVARAAEWNTSVFRKEGKDSIMEVVQRYLSLAIEFDYTFVIVKYNVQQLLGGEQDSEQGRRFLATGTMRDLCAVYGREKDYEDRQAYIRRQRSLASAAAASSGPAAANGAAGGVADTPFTNFEKRRESENVPRKRKLTGTDDEVTELFCPFVRAHYADGRSIPKVRLLQWARQKGLEQPVYDTRQTDKTFRSVVLVDGQRFQSGSWEKNKKYAEQASAIVALRCLNVGAGADASADQDKTDKENGLAAKEKKPKIQKCEG